LLTWADKRLELSKAEADTLALKLGKIEVVVERGHLVVRKGGRASDSNKPAARRSNLPPTLATSIKMTVDRGKSHSLK